MFTKINDVYKKAFLENTRYKILLGGRGAGRSTVASQNAILNLFQNQYYRAAIMRNVFGDIRDSIFKECQDRIEEFREQQEKPLEEALEKEKLTLEEFEIEKKKLLINQIKVNSSLKSFYNPLNKNQIIAKGFKKSSSQQTAKLKSLANFTHVYIEEADENSEEDFNQLSDSIRKKGSNIQIWQMLNPPHENHWIIKKWFNLLPSEFEGFYIPELKTEFKEDVTFVYSNYKHNLQNIDERTILQYEGYKETNLEHYCSMILGLIPSIKRGRIFKDWKPISDEEYKNLPFDESFGLDFGFKNDPLALIGMKHHNQILYFKEYIYEKGLTNQDFVKRFYALGLDPNSEIFADSAEPKSIEEIAQEGLNIMAVEKPKGSIISGIKEIEGMRDVFYTENSNNLKSELQEYSWKENKSTGQFFDEPIDKHNHLIDAARYSLQSIGRISDIDIPMIDP